MNTATWSGPWMARGGLRSTPHHLRIGLGWRTSIRATPCFNDAGTRPELVYGPAATASLVNGETGVFRGFTEYVYDDEAPSLGGPKPANPPVSYDLVVKQRVGTTNASRDGSEFDVTTTLYEYDPVVAGDGSGWDLGTPTRTRQQDGAGWSTTIDRYSADGGLIETRRPGGAATASGVGTDARTSRYAYYTAGAHPTDSDCGNKPPWEDLPCKTSPGGQPSGPTVPTTWHKAYNSDLAPTVVEERSGATTRTTTTVYDALGRTTSTGTVIAGGVPGDQFLPAAAISYDNTTGLPTVLTAGSKTITTGYDAWGRVTGYTDAASNHAVTTYNPAGATATFHDGADLYTYAYDARGFLTGVDAGAGIGSFSYGYTTTGQVNKVTYPNGLAASYDHNEAGTNTRLTYAQGGTELLAFTARVDVTGRTLAQTSPGGEQAFTFDDLGRLVKTHDVRDATGCLTRTYGFDASSNRTTSASHGPDASGLCQTTTPTSSRANTFDPAGRIRDTGYTYDNLGRTLTVPAADTTSGGLSVLTNTYYANDMIASMAQTVEDGSGGSLVKTIDYAVDPGGRIDSIITKAGGAETIRTQQRYSGGSDSPSLVRSSTNGGVSWTDTRYVTVPEVGMALTVTAGVATVQLTNLHGDLVATQPNTPGTTTIASYAETDEYGNPIPAGTPTARYGWLGTHQRSTETLGGTTLMGVRIYNPTTGQFHSQDPVADANPTPYAYPQDPINFNDTTGAEPWWNKARRHALTASTCSSFGKGNCEYILYVTALARRDYPGNSNRKNFVRHFVWIVSMSYFVSSDAAKSIGWAHEYGLVNHGDSGERFDSRRDRYNNRFAIRWYRSYYRLVRNDRQYSDTARGFLALLAFRANTMFDHGYGFHG
ncbi:MAG: RHS repeat-associated core domain-containing protein [Nocardioides sp.]